MISSTIALNLSAFFVGLCSYDVLESFIASAINRSSEVLGCLSRGSVLKSSYISSELIFNAFSTKLTALIIAYKFSFTVMIKTV